jgi:hypothetical protein
MSQPTFFQKNFLLMACSFCRIMFGTGHFSLITRLVLLHRVPGSRQGDDQWKQNTNAQLFGTRKIFKHKGKKEKENGRGPGLIVCCTFGRLVVHIYAWEAPTLTSLDPSVTAPLRAKVATGGPSCPPLCVLRPHRCSQRRCRAKLWWRGGDALGC